jgi:hypothetical protein
VLERAEDRLLLSKIGPNSTTTIFSASPTPAVFGQPVTLTARVNVNSPGAGTPTGTVTFEKGTTVLGTGTLSTTKGVTSATLTTSTLAVGIYGIIASYGGDANDQPSASSGYILPISQDATSTTVAPSLTAPVFGQPETYTATVRVNSPGAGTPTGTVTFEKGSTVLGTGTLSTTNGVTTATFSTTSQAAGNYGITASYGGDANDQPSAGSYLLPITKDATTTTVAPSVTAPVFGQPETFTATVRVNSPGAGTPTGTVTFLDGTTVLGTGILSTIKGVTTTTFATASLAAGAHSVTATYNGDTNDLPATTNPVALTVAQETVAPTLSVSSVSPVFGQPETLTATVSINNAGAAAPTGTVTFQDGTTVLGTGTLSTSNGVTSATFTTSSLAIGVHSITAIYSGDTNVLPATTNPVTLTVAQDATTIALAAAVKSPAFGQPETFTATVSVNRPGAGTPTGTVTLRDGTTVLGTGTLSTSNGVTSATFTTSSLATGIHSMTATYNGDTNDLPAMSGLVSLTVNLGLSPATLPEGKAGLSYSATFAAAGGSGSYSFALAPGSTLPKGLSLSIAGVLSGTTTVAGTFSFTVQATDTHLAGLTGTQTLSLTVSPGAATSFRLVAPSGATAGAPFNVTITARDAYGNTATGYNGAATLTSSDGESVAPAPIPFTSGTGSTTVTLTLAHAVTLTASAGPLTGSSSVSVSPGAAASFRLVAPGGATVYLPFNVTIKAVDRFGNLATGYNGTVTLSSSNARSVPSTPLRFTSGSATTSLTPSHSGATTLTATAGAIQSNSVTVQVSPTEYWWTVQCEVEYYDDDDNIQSFWTDPYMVPIPEPDSAQATGYATQHFSIVYHDAGYDIITIYAHSAAIDGPAN